VVLAGEGVKMGEKSPDVDPNGQTIQLLKDIVEELRSLNENISELVKEVART
jgi:hypothetical protein